MFFFTYICIFIFSHTYRNYRFVFDGYTNVSDLLLTTGEAESELEMDIILRNIQSGLINIVTDFHKRQIIKNLKELKLTPVPPPPPPLLIPDLPQCPLSPQCSEFSKNRNRTHAPCCKHLITNDPGSIQLTYIQY